MKKIITVTAAALLATSLAACGNPAPPGPPPAPIAGCSWEYDDGQWECDDHHGGFYYMRPGYTKPYKTTTKTTVRTRKGWFGGTKTTTKTRTRVGRR